jgi:hypothetical protein
MAFIVSIVVPTGDDHPHSRKITLGSSASSKIFCVAGNAYVAVKSLHGGWLLALRDCMEKFDQ